MSAKGEINLAPYSFFNGVRSRPPMVMFSSEGRKDSLDFVEETKEFVCNLATWDLREQMNQTSAPYPRGINEMTEAGPHRRASRLVKPPRVAEAPCALECKWLQTVAAERRRRQAVRRLAGDRPGRRRAYRRALHQERPARHRRHEADRARRLSRLFGADRELHHAPADKRRTTRARPAWLKRARPAKRWNFGSVDTLTFAPAGAAAFHHNGALPLPSACRAGRIIGRASRDQVRVFHFLRRSGQKRRPGCGRGCARIDRHRRAERPSIGLALGGGAARGFAHIGVIRTLLAKGSTPTSSPAPRSARSSAAATRPASSTRSRAWGRGLTRRSLLSYLDVSFSGSGLLGGGKLADKIAEAIGDVTIDKLPMRYAAIATEIGTGHEIWITRGMLRTRCAPPTRCRESFRRSGSATAGWSTARWSIRCRSRSRARSARAWSSRSTSTPICSAAAPRSRIMALAPSRT